MFKRLRSYFKRPKRIEIALDQVEIKMDAQMLSTTLSLIILKHELESTKEERKPLTLWYPLGREEKSPLRG